MLPPGKDPVNAQQVSTVQAITLFLGEAISCNPHLEKKIIMPSTYYLLNLTHLAFLCLDPVCRERFITTKPILWMLDLQDSACGVARRTVNANAKPLWAESEPAGKYAEHIWKY